MALQSSGAISLLNVQNEFGGSSPINISEYYGADTGVPSSGAISLYDFYGKSAEEPGLPRRTFSENKLVEMGRASSTPGFGGRPVYIDHYPIRGLSALSSGGIEDAGLFTEGQRTAYPPTYSDLQGVALNEFNRFSISGASNAAWDFREYTEFDLTVSGGAGNSVPKTWKVTNPIWSVHSSGIIYLSGGTCYTPDAAAQGAVGLGQYVAQCVDEIGKLYLAFDFLS
jgi:hypothetical protein